MSSVSIRALQKRYGDSLAVKQVDLEIAQGEFVTLLGPSGCGKTTTLRCLAGLEVPTGGEIRFGERVVFSARDSVFVPPESRGLGMVFQSYALWPHMTVRQTVGYPLKLARTPRAELDRAVNDTLDRVALSSRGGDAAVSLSGGQQQRVALARALVNTPAVTLFDEPLSNLDVKLRHSMRAQIRQLHDEMGTTSVYVTHDQEEAIALADRVIVMKDGEILQVGTAREVYTRPQNAFVADFMGFQNILAARTVTDSIVELDRIGSRVWVAGGELPASGEPVQVAFRASHVHVERVSDDATKDSGDMVGQIHFVTYLGSALRLLVHVGGVAVRAQIDERDFGLFGPEDLQVGRTIRLRIAPDQLVALPAPGKPGHAEAAPASTMTLNVRN
jgi:iron(III) transport system ATP-binding protein